jgi:hypothetical protein
MHPLHDNRYTLWLQGGLNQIGDLAGHAFLHLKSAGVHIHNTGDFRKSDHFASG